MAQTVKLIARGLDTNTSELARPSGSLSRAENVRILRDGIIQSRRGFTTMPLLGGPVSRLFSYQNKLFAHYGTTPGLATVLKYYDGATWQLVDSFDAADAPVCRLRNAEANKNLYLNDSTGIFKLDAYNAVPVLAGMPKALPFHFATSGLAGGASGFLGASKQVAYRYVLSRLDANENKLVSSPSGRMVIQNTTAGADDVTVEGVLPVEVQTGDIITLYRSVQTALTVEPPDEMGRVYEAPLSAGDISALTFSITDTVPDELRDETLYTSPSQEGILQSNDPPPVHAADLATYKGCLFFSDAWQPQRFFFDILAVGGSAGIQVGDQIKLESLVLTAATSETTSGDYLLETSLASAALNNRATAQNLCWAINASHDNFDFYAYYLSGPDDFVGKVMIERRPQTSGGFYVYALTGSGAPFNPVLATSAPTDFQSKGDTLPHGAWFSKQDEPEAVPPLNFVQMGSAAAKVRRMVAARDSLFFLKEDGVWRLNGSGPDDFTLTQIDPNCVLIANESVATLNGRVWCLTRQGVVAISESGVELMSYPVETDLLSLMTATDYDSVIASYAWGCGYESDHLYLLGVPTSSSATTCARTYVFSEASDSIVTDIKDALCAHVSPDTDLFHLGNYETLDGTVYQERKTRTSTDYQDGTTAIPCVVEFSPDALGMPGEAKHLRELALLFSSDADPSGSITVGLATELDSATVTLSATEPNARTLIPMQCRRATRLKVTVSLARKAVSWLLLGVAITFEPYGPRVGR